MTDYSSGLKRLELGLTWEEVEAIEVKVTPKNYFMFSEIIEATRVDGKIDRFEREFLRKKAVELSIPLEVSQNLILSATRNVGKKSTLRRLMGLG